MKSSTVPLILILLLSACSSGNIQIDSAALPATTNPPYCTAMVSSTDNIQVHSSCLYKQNNTIALTFGNLDSADESPSTDDLLAGTKLLTHPQNYNYMRTVKSAIRVQWCYIIHVH